MNHDDKPHVYYCPVLGCHDHTGNPRPLQPHQPICDTCTHRTRRNITKAPQLHQALRSRERRRNPTTTGPITGTRTPQTTWDIHADTIADHLLDTLQEYARTALILTGQPATGTLPARPHWRLQQSLDTLTHHDHALLTHPYYAPAYAHDTLRWLRTAWHHLGYGTGQHNLTNPCPRCDLLTLTHYSNINDTITCRYCRLTWDETAFAELAAQWLHHAAHEQAANQ